MLIRPAAPSETRAVLEVHRAAFGQDTEARLVEALLDDPTARPLHSLIAEREGVVAGHILFTRISIDGTDVTASILCPLAVLPEHHGKGAGSALIRAGLQDLRVAGCDLVFVLGDPAYYGRFGFSQADLTRFPTPQPIPRHYHPGWMVQDVSVRSPDGWRGQLACADALNKPEYWSG